MKRIISIVLCSILAVLSVSAYASSDSELISAMHTKDCKKVAKLLADGTSPNALFEDYTTKIKMPVIFIGPINDGGCIKKTLVENGADINYQVFFKNKESEGYFISPLSSAVMHGMADDVELFLKLGANVREKDKYGNNLVEQALLRYMGGNDRNKKQSIINLLKSYGY